MQSIENYNLSGTRAPVPAIPAAPAPAARSTEPAPRNVKPVAGRKPAKKIVRSTTGRPTVPQPGGWERRKGGAALVRSPETNAVAEILRADGLPGLLRGLRSATRSSSATSAGTRSVPWSCAG